MWMKKKSRTFVAVLMAMLFAFTALCPVIFADAANVKVTAAYDPSTGALTATVNTTLSGTVTYQWTGGSGTSASLSGPTATPTEAGEYVCTVTVTKPAASSSSSSSSKTATASTTSKTYKSNSIALYKVSCDSFVKLNSAHGLYRAGENVRANAMLEGNQQVTGWSTSIPGLELPKSGNTTFFTMPASSLDLVCSAPNLYPIKVSGGKADHFVASPGTRITVKASDIDGKVFSSWTTSGLTSSASSSSTKNATTASSEDPILSFAMPASEVELTANFITEEEAAAAEAAKKAEESGETGTSATSGSGVKEEVYSTDSFTDPTRLKYTVTRTNHYKVRMYHAKLGQGYDKAFKQACKKDTLITNYFTLIINDDKSIMESPGPVTVVLTLPEDVQKNKRNFRMICISRKGKAYSFEDEDEDDTTLTFSANRFGAYAIAYNDRDYEAEKAAAEEAAAKAAEAAKQASYEQGKAEGFESGHEAGYDEGFSAGQAAATPAEPEQTEEEPAVETPTMISSSHSASESQTAGTGSGSGSSIVEYSGADFQHISSGGVGSSSTVAPATFTL